jgi:mannose-6-phosphate isomerase-like protein (cupin superfamily)
MNHPVCDIDSAEHYTWGDSCDGWHLLKDPALSVIQERVPPFGAEIAHFHTRARQFFYVLSAIATMEFETESVTFGPGQGMHVPPNTVHRFVNRSEEEVVFLVVSSPASIGDRTNISAPIHGALFATQA